jgi:RHS repeat-associated protein
LKEVRKNTVLSEQYAYDSNANRTGTLTATAQYDIQDRIIRQGGTVYEIDVDGFMTKRGSDIFTYSAKGELLQAVAGGNTLNYAYDGYGRRVGRKVGSGQWYQYFYGNPYNENQVTATRDTAGTLTVYYYDDFGSLFAFQRGEVWYYVGTDQVGTPKVVSNALGSVVKTVEYDSYGVLINDSNSAFDFPIGFAGGINDPTSGLVRFGARDYDPRIGRWTAKDPMLFISGELNLYTYVLNNPVSLADSSGMAWSFYPASVGAILGAIAGFTSEIPQQLLDSKKKFSWREVGAATLAGAFGGALTGAFVGAATGDPSAAICVTELATQAGITVQIGIGAGIVEGVTKDPDFISEFISDFKKARERANLRATTANKRTISGAIDKYGMMVQ